MTPEERAAEIIRGVSYDARETRSAIAAAIREAERDMQRRCAEVARHWCKNNDMGDNFDDDLCEWIADDIEARGKP